MAFVGGPFGTPAMVKPLKFSWEEPAVSIIVDKDNEDWNYQQVSCSNLLAKSIYISYSKRKQTLLMSLRWVNIRRCKITPLSRKFVINLFKISAQGSDLTRF